MENNVNYKTTDIIFQIFEDYWDNYYKNCKNIIALKRTNAPREVLKVINCTNHNLGTSVYACLIYDEVIYSHHICEGKLCSSCSIKSQKIKTVNILE